MDVSQTNTYDKLYLADKNAFGKVHKIVERLTQYISSGSVLDLGAGGGGNSIFLAQHGFAVHAIDASPIAMSMLKERAEAENLPITTEVADISSRVFNTSYDVTLCTFVLHFLTTDKAIECVRSMQAHTRQGGFNVITTFTTQGDLSKENQSDSDRFLIANQDVLKDLYADWDVHVLFEKETGLRKKREDGTPLTNMFVGLIAQKR